jgi:hypothetical protein
MAVPTLKYCPYCGADYHEKDSTPLSDHIRGAHQRDADGEYRCPAVVEQRKALGLPPDGHGATRHCATDGGLPP